MVNMNTDIIVTCVEWSHVTNSCIRQRIDFLNFQRNLELKILFCDIEVEG